MHLMFKLFICVGSYMFKFDFKVKFLFDMLTSVICISEEIGILSLPGQIQQCPLHVYIV